VGRAGSKLHPMQCCRYTQCNAATTPNAIAATTPNAIAATTPNTIAATTPNAIAAQCNCCHYTQYNCCHYTQCNRCPLCNCCNYTQCNCCPIHPMQSLSTCTGVRKLHRQLDTSHVEGWPELYIHTVYDRMYGDLPAKNAVYTPYIPINVWFWPTLHT